MEEGGRPAKLEHYRDREVARTYGRRWSGAAGRRRNARKARALRRGLEILRRQGGPLATALDLPCGQGRFTGLLRSEGLEPVGADLSLAMLAEARAAWPGERFLAADAARLPFADGAFDLVLCIRFLHLVRDPGLRRAFLMEMGRVARKAVLLDYHHGHTLRIQGRRLRHRLGLLERAPGNPSPATIRKEVGAAGLQLLAWIPVRRTPWIGEKVVLALRPEGAPAGD